jgi:hypothetical protein
MNLFEVLVAVVFFVVAVLLTAYIGYLAADLAKLKYIFEATRHASCEATNTSGPIVISSCVRFYFANGSFVVEVYNITTGYPYTS